MSAKGCAKNKEGKKFSTRASAYMLAYLAFENQSEASINAETTTSSTNIAAKIETMVKEFKTHRCMLEFDGSFIIFTLFVRD
jgi:hypothetical protein